MGKRARISWADLPNENKNQALLAVQSSIAQYLAVADRRRRVQIGTNDYRLLSEKVNGLRQVLQKQFQTLREIDLAVGRELERGFELYTDNANSYYGQKLQASVGNLLAQEEVKKINHLIHTLHNEQDKAKLQSYIDAKSPVELNKLVKIAIQKYQEKRSDYARKNLNNFLGYFHKKLESTAYSRAPKDEIRATRADFNGFFNIPSVTEVEMYQPYSKAFLQASMQQNKQVYDPFSYRLEQSQTWKIWEKTSMLGMLEMPLRQALGNQGIKPQDVASFTSADFERVLFNEYAKAKYNPKFGNTLNFSDIDESLESRHKQFFWKYNAMPTKEAQQQFAQGLLRKGVEQAYIDVLMKSILEEGNPNPKVDRNKFKGKIPYFSTHHKKPIYAIGALANRQSNYVGIAEFKDVQDVSRETPEHDVWHLGDSVVRKSFGELANGDQLYEPVVKGKERGDDYMEYLADTRFDTQNDGKSWTVSLGYKEEDNIRAEITEFSQQHEKTQTIETAKNFSSAYHAQYSKQNMTMGFAR